MLILCDQTGLSQVHNLYFVACASQIYVYIPQFPTQKLAEKPVLIFTSQPSAPDLRGYLPGGPPHAINSLVVKFLGTEEVIAVVRDDGDVDAFLVRHIVSAIERRAEPLGELSVLGDEVRPFFQSNVGISAWGLDIHTESRILATSSNNHEVRVFKFGLLQAAEDGSSDSEDDPIPGANNAKLMGDERGSDVTQQILNGQSNIPCISFCNTGDDPEGRWLLTTDLSGICRLVDLHESKPTAIFRFGPSFTSHDSPGHDRNNAGWMVGFIDRRLFQEEDSVDTALGLTESWRLVHPKHNPDVWDISNTVQRFPEFMEPFVRWRTKRRRKNQENTVPGVSQASDNGDVSTDENNELGSDDATQSGESSDGGARLDEDIEIGAMEREAESAEYSHDAFDIYIPDNEEGSEGDSSSGEWRTDSEQAETSNADPEQVTVVDDADDPDDEMTEDSMPFTAWYNGESIVANRPNFHELVHRQDANDSPWHNLPLPIFHASVRNFYLLQPFINQPSGRIPPRPFNPPMVGLANPLRQAIQSDFEFLRDFERLNMMVSLPPLGIIVLASQKGRALVLQLTKVPAHADYPNELTQPSKEGKRAPLDWMNKTQYTFRVACMLPFASQEAANERPFAPLHGLAASPLQGCGESVKAAGAEGSKWRVMLMYQDHSVLSYMIGRQSDGTEGMGAEDGVEVEDLIV